MNFKPIKKEILSHDRIILHRHKKPDMDAIGSQMGLKLILEKNFPEKDIYVVGDQNRFDYENQMQQIPDSFYQNALVFVTDVSVSHLISDDRFKLADKVIIIDHHRNETDVENAMWYCDPTYEAACGLVYDICKKLKFEIPAKAADYLLNGLITDSGRFQYIQNGQRLLKISSELVGLGAEPVKFYKWLYVETLDERNLKNKISQRMQIEEKVGYFFNDKDFLESLGEYDFFTISRGMVNLLAGIKEIPIWANFTYNKEDNTVIAEVRSRDIPVVEICKKHGGGGHQLACGATLKDFEEAKEMIKELNELYKTHMEGEK